MATRKSSKDRQTPVAVIIPEASSAPLIRASSDVGLMDRVVSILEQARASTSGSSTRHTRIVLPRFVTRRVTNCRR